ncbi:hypothetical protein [Archangium violaceum]|uniref:Uncharacterized protein n=1 Tax=Archangium violaceum Cb vi76 TaxID=1406225 RepID=A0A084SLP9_9BACT|nr:hypothetical protein [Archangium violaceum]KFA89384.1 hypothetical protein Q664_35465 [Archangium violaceum Cb vi76]
MTEAVEALAGAGQQRPDLAGAVVFRGAVASHAVRCVGSEFLWTQGARAMNRVRVEDYDACKAACEEEMARVRRSRE